MTSNCSGETSPLSSFAHEFPCGFVLLIALMKFMGKPSSLSRDENASNGLSVTTPPKSKKIALSTGVTLMRSQALALIHEVPRKGLDCKVALASVAEPLRWLNRRWRYTPLLNTLLLPYDRD